MEHNSSAERPSDWDNKLDDAMNIVLNGQVLVLPGLDPTTTLLDFLRTRRRLSGTKEGCAEGDCGACTVLLEREEYDHSIARIPINSCLTMLGQLDGTAIRTVEGLISPDGRPHPFQISMAEENATQCGFCTPGFVMSGYAHVAACKTNDHDAIHDALSGNLCRCTGYKPIVRAIERMIPLNEDPLSANDKSIGSAIRSVRRSRSATFDAGGHRFHVPSSLPELLVLRAAEPDASLLAGGTDLGLKASRDRKPPASIIHLSRVPELHRISETESLVTIGAAVTYADMLPVFNRLFPSTTTYLTRLGSRQIRSLGTIGGNLGTGSPIGDGLPLLLALGANVHLRSAERGHRVVSIDDYFLGYRKTVLASDEIIESVEIPKLLPGEKLVAEKVSKRRDQDISAVALVCWVRLDNDNNNKVQDIRLAYGGMAAIPKRAVRAEAALKNRKLDRDAVLAAAPLLLADLAPIDDLRASAAYRSLVAANLLHRIY
jgi:xanthine dehydrogenase small subunit